MPIANCNKRLQVTIHEDLYEALEHEAKRNYDSKSDYVTRALLYYIGKESKENERR